MFHVELRQFPHVARAFNLAREELDTGVLAAWVAGESVELNERRFSPERARLTVLEGRALEQAEIGLGRGWANAARAGVDVTEQVLAEAQGGLPASELEQLKHELAQRCATQAMPISSVPELIGRRYPGRRASEQLALAERSVWQLLNERKLALLVDGAPVEQAQWQPLLLSWETWSNPRVVIAAAGR